jgi:hypothetical protein
MAEEARQEPEPMQAPEPTQAPDPPFVPDPPPIPATEPAPVVTSTVPEANYHIFLWPDPPGPPLYLCLLCPLRDASEAVIRAHITTEHSADPLPTPLAANPPLIDPVTGLQAVRSREEGPPNA